jgi:septum site-determining protein MinD
MTTVYAVASAKGGVGKTTTTAAIATILARSGADVVAIDADIGMANLAGVLGVTPGETTLHDVLAGRAEPLDAVHERPEGLRVVPGADDLDAYASADPAGLAGAVAAFEDADYVFVDAGAGLSHDSTLPLAIADETLLVSTAERSALGDTEKTRQLAERLGGTVAGAAITRVDPDADPGEVEVDGLDDVTDVLDATVLGRIPEDDAVMRAATANRPLTSFAPDAPATRAYRDLARALTDATVDGAGLGADGEEADEDGDQTDDADEDGDQTDDADEDGDQTDDADEDGDQTDDADEDGDQTDDADTDDETEDDIDTVDAAEEDIIVADAEAGGLGDPGDEEEIIVADEAPVSEGTAADVADDVDMETVGEEHVDGDDLEAMIEENIDEAEAFEGTDATDSDDGDATSADDETEADDDATDGPEDPDDKLAGSVPFRDDDTGSRGAVPAKDGDDDEADETDETDEEAADGDDVERSGGFFSRLLGR